MSITFSNCDTNERNSEFETEIEDLREKVEKLTRENEKWSSDIRLKENEFRRQLEELNIDNQILRKTIENLEELNKKLKENENISHDNSPIYKVKQNLIESENKLIISKNSELRLQIQFENLLRENKDLKKELQNNQINKPRTNNYMISGENEELENVNELKDIIFQLSSEYDELQLKYNNILDCFYEKERIILELKDKHNLKEDEFLRKIFKYEEEITNLNEKLDENEKKKHNVNSIKIIENL